MVNQLDIVSFLANDIIKINLFQTKLKRSYFKVEWLIKIIVRETAKN
jgi:hypothetical protein